MPHDELLDLVPQVETFCKEAGLGLFYGFARAKERIIWEKRSASELGNFLLAFKASGSRMLHLEAIPLEEERLSDFKESVNRLPAEEKTEEVLSALRTLEERKRQTMYLTLSFYLDGLLYHFGLPATWMEAVNLLDSLAYEDDEDEEETLEDFAENEVEKWARKLLHHKHYLAAPAVGERRSFAVQLLLNQIEDRAEVYAIARRAEDLYQAEIQPKQDADIIEKLQALKDEKEGVGKKLSKAEAMRKLSLTLTQINKYWS